MQESNSNKRLDIAGAVLWPANFKVHSRMNISCDAQDQLSPMPEMLIKTSTWYVKFRLAVHNAPDFYIAQHIKQVLDSSDQERHIRTLSNVSFSYSAEHQWYRNSRCPWNFSDSVLRDEDEIIIVTFVFCVCSGCPPFVGTVTLWHMIKFIFSSKKQLCSKSNLHSPNLCPLLCLEFRIWRLGSRDKGLGFRV